MSHIVQSWLRAIYTSLSSSSSVISVADCSVACQRWSQVKLTMCQAQVDDLNQCPGQLGLRIVSLHLINVHRLLSDNLTWKKPLVPPRRNYWYFECIVFLSRTAGWVQVGCRPAGSAGSESLQSLDSNQGASRCQESHAHSGPRLGPSVTSALRTILRDSATQTSQGKSTHIYLHVIRLHLGCTDF